MDRAVEAIAGPTLRNLGVEVVVDGDLPLVLDEAHRDIGDALLRQAGD